MADHDKVEYATATGNDYPAHEQTYRTFVALVKWHVYGLIVLLALMAYFLV
jgi:hypothetical protein